MGGKPLGRRGVGSQRFVVCLLSHPLVFVFGKGLSSPFLPSRNVCMTQSRAAAATNQQARNGSPCLHACGGCTTLGGPSNVLWGRYGEGARILPSQAQEASEEQVPVFLLTPGWEHHTYIQAQGQTGRDECMHIHVEV